MNTDMTYSKTKGLCSDAKMIREEVFVTEQGFAEEFDEIDETSVHLVFYIQGEPIAVCRYFKGNGNHEYVAGRIAVRKVYRGRKIGNELMHILEQNIKVDGGKKIILSAQQTVQKFYESVGFRSIGQPYMDQHCAHIKMEKELIF